MKNLRLLLSSKRTLGLKRGLLSIQRFVILASDNRGFMCAVNHYEYKQAYLPLNISFVSFGNYIVKRIFFLLCDVVEGILATR